MLSVVIPVFNEEESVEILYKELTKELIKLKKEYEIIFVDDDSTDNSLKTLKDISSKDKKIKVFSFRKHMGKAEALSLGFSKSKGDYIVTMDSDLEDKPSELHKLLEKIEEGWDGVSGWRKNRKHSLSRVLSSRLSNLFIGIFWGLHLHDYNCGYKIFRKEAVKSLNLYGGLYRFMTLLVFLQGYSVTEVVVEHQNRKYGKSKFGFFKLWKDLPDIFTMLFITNYGKRPFHFFGTIGIFLFFLGSLILGYLLVIKIMGQAIGGRPILFLGMILVLIGFQTFLTGFLADLIINSSSKETKEYPLKDVWNK